MSNTPFMQGLSNRWAQLRQPKRPQQPQQPQQPPPPMMIASAPQSIAGHVSSGARVGRSLVGGA